MTTVAYNQWIRSVNIYYIILQLLLHFTYIQFLNVINFFFYISFTMSLFIYPFIYLIIYLLFYLSIHLSNFFTFFYLSFYLSIYLVIYLSYYFFLNPCGEEPMNNKETAWEKHKNVSVPVIRLRFLSSAPANPATWAPRLNPIICTLSMGNFNFVWRPSTSMATCFPTSLVLAAART